MTQPTLEDFINYIVELPEDSNPVFKDFIQYLENEEAKAQTDKDIDAEYSGDPFDYDDDEPMSLIEQVITSFLGRCASQAAIPTLDEAKSIVILDGIASKYNTIPQIAVRKGSLDSDNKAKFFAGENFEYTGSSSDIMVPPSYA